MARSLTLTMMPFRTSTSVSTSACNITVRIEHGGIAENTDIPSLSMVYNLENTLRGSLMRGNQLVRGTKGSDALGGCSQDVLFENLR